MNRRVLLAMLALLPAVSRSQSLGDALNAIKDSLISGEPSKKMRPAH